MAAPAGLPHFSRRLRVSQQGFTSGVSTPAQVSVSVLIRDEQSKQEEEHQDPKRHWTLQLLYPYEPALEKHAAQPEESPVWRETQEDMEFELKLNHPAALLPQVATALGKDPEPLPPPILVMIASSASVQAPV